MNLTVLSVKDSWLGSCPRYTRNRVGQLHNMDTTEPHIPSHLGTQAGELHGGPSGGENTEQEPHARGEKSRAASEDTRQSDTGRYMTGKSVYAHPKGTIVGYEEEPTG